MRKAFTLIELLVVMAITGVLLTLIVLPIFQSFNFTRTAQAFADAQDKGRLLTERIAREVGNAISVRDAASTIVVVPDGIGGTREVELPYTKLDLIPPAQGTPDPTLAPGTYRDPDTGKVDPTLTRPKGDINLNVVPGATIVRWFVGLNRPFNADGTVATYNEPYTGLLMARGGGRDNLYVLRRAEVQPFIYRARKDGLANSNAWRPNLAYFRSDDNRNDGGEFDTRIVDLDDPKFFLPDNADAQKNLRVARWAGLGSLNGTDLLAINNGKRTGNAAIQTEISRYDMIRPLVAGSPPQAVKDASGRVTVVPLVQFRPTRVGSAPAAGSAAARPGEAVEGLDRIGPDTYKTDRGLWTNALVKYYPGGYAPGDPMEVASVNAYGAVTIFNGGYDAGGADGIALAPNDYQLFDAQEYERILGRGGDYAFSNACVTPSNWQTNPLMREIFTPFRILTKTGHIVTSFPIEKVGTTARPNGVPNLPEVTVGVSRSPSADPAADATAPLSPTQPGYDPNRAFNRVFNANPDLQGVVQRFIDLRFVPNADGTPSPLCPIYNAGYPTFTGFEGFTGFTVPTNGSTVNRVHIVPNSDEVYGKDQNPGPAYGLAVVRYTRVTGEPGPNQYRLVYADLAEPTETNGQVTAAAYQLLGLSATQIASGGGFDPATYKDDNLVSTVIQSKFKAGYMQFCSDPNIPLPVGSLTVKYRFQFNGPNDTFDVDYDTREEMQILLTIKNYPQSNAPNAQTITLKSTATLRNALR